MKLNKHSSDTFTSTTRSMSHFFYFRLGNCRIFFLFRYFCWLVFFFLHHIPHVQFYISKNDDQDNVRIIFLANIFSILWHFYSGFEQSNGLFSNATISCTLRKYEAHFSKSRLNILRRQISLRVFQSLSGISLGVTI